MPRNGVEELDVVMGVAAGSLRLQPSEFIESRKDEEAMASVGGARDGGWVQRRTGQDGSRQIRTGRTGYGKVYRSSLTAAGACGRERESAWASWEA